MAHSKTQTKAGESLDRICGDLEVFQAEKGYRFGVETLLLAGFVAKQAGKMVDLGTGSGILPLVLTRFGKVNSAIGVEIQPAMADRARRTVAHNRMESQVEIVEADLCDLEGRLPASQFDLVVANPPFATGKTGHHSRGTERAVARHEILCTLEDVVKSASRLLKSRAKFVVVFPTARLVELLGLCGQNKLTPARLRMIHGRIELPAKHCLLEAVKSGRMGMVVEPPLIVYENSEDYTDEVKAMLYPSGSTNPAH